MKGKAISSGKLKVEKSETDKDVEKGPHETADQPSTAPPLPSVEASKTSTTKAKGADEKDEKLEYDPEDDVWTLEEGKASVGRKYARSVMDAFRPVLYISTILGLFPLIPKRANDGTYTIKFSWYSYATILFLLMATIVVGTTFWMLLSIICISINAPEHPSIVGGKSGDIYRSEEIFVYKRNTVGLIIMIASFINLTICMVAVFLRKDYIAKQLVYWTEVVELLQLDVGRNVGKRLWKQIAVIVVFAVIITALYAIGASPGLAGAGSTFYIILTRVIDPLSHWHGGMSVRRLVCSLFLLYSIVAGYLYILWFFYNCRILVNILRIWNNRFQYCLHKQILEFTSAQQSRDIRLGVKQSNRTSRAQLFQDHLVIFNLLEGVNAQFEVIMESFYLSTMIMIVFEAYGFVHACFYDEYSKCGRQADLLPILLFLSLQVYMYIIVTLEASGVADEARHVLDIVRRKGMMTSRMDNELWFMLSMRLSFGGHEDVGIIGAGYLYVTKSFLLGAISAITSHFIIFYQFEVPYAQTNESDTNLGLLNLSSIIKHLEGPSFRSQC